MACSHASSCPLFPKLNASLESWRISYCDTDSNWENCERFRQSRAGKPVPIGLLPSGFLAHAIVDEDARTSAITTQPATAHAASSASEAKPDRSHRVSFFARLFGRSRRATAAKGQEELV